MLTLTKNNTSSTCDLGPSAGSTTLIYTPQLRILATGQKASRARCGMVKANPSLLFRGKIALYCVGDELEYTVQIPMRA